MTDVDHAPPLHALGETHSVTRGAVHTANRNAIDDATYGAIMDWNPRVDHDAALYGAITGIIDTVLAEDPDDPA